MVIREMNLSPKVLLSCSAVSEDSDDRGDDDGVRGAGELENSDLHDGCCYCSDESRDYRTKAVNCRPGRSAFLLVVLSFLLAALPCSQPLSAKAGGIRVEVNVPKEAEVGATAELKCEWAINGTLYSVKWYKDDHEFFRYVPDNTPRIQTFPQQGVYLDRKANSENSIRLTQLTLNTSGQYKCEVSTEGPSFDTTYRTANLTVIAVPERGPEITGLASHYAVGENVTANCTAWPSVPKAKIYWTVNDELMSRENVIEYPEQVGPFRGRASRQEAPQSLGLHLEAEPRYFQNNDGAVRVRCVTEVGSRRYEIERRVLMAHVNNQRLSAGDLLRGGSGRFVPNNFLVVLTLVVLFIATRTTRTTRTTMTARVRTASIILTTGDIRMT